MSAGETSAPSCPAGSCAIREGSMPPWYYYAVHWAAKLSPKEKAQLIAGLERTFQASPPIGGG